MSLINARVAQILTERELVLNKGSDAGVEIGMRFRILRPKGADIRDPDDGKVLGSVELVKTVVKVTEVQPALSVAQTFRTIETPGYGIAGVSSAMALFGQPGGTRVETLRTSEKRIQQDLDEADSFVKIGDPAVQVGGDASAALDADQTALPRKAIDAPTKRPRTRESTTRQK